MSGDGSTKAARSSSFLLLGPLEAAVDGESLPLGGPKQRAVLAMLLLADGSAVSVRTLTRGLWQTAPSGSANVLQIHMSRLRQLLDPGARTRAPESLRLIHSPAGYALIVPRQCVDVARAQAVAAAIPSRPTGHDGMQAYAVRLRQALDEWRGEPLAEFVTEPFAESCRLQLGELRVSLTRAFVDAELELGHHDNLIAELYAVIAEFPFHEAFRERLITALYRAGRQADAFAAFDDAAALLRTELGVDPGPHLLALRARMLRHDPALGVRAVEPAAQTSATIAEVHHDQGVRARERLIVAEVMAQATTTRQPRLLTVFGDAGMGKTHLMTACARHAQRSTLVRCDPDATGQGLAGLVRMVLPNEAGQTTNASIEQLRVILQRRLNELTRAGPYALVVDDAQWASDALLDTIHLLAARTTGPVVILVGARAELLDRRPSWAIDVPFAQAVQLGPLPDDEAATLCEQAAGHPLDPALRRRLVAESRGSPLLLTEHVAELLRHQGRLRYRGVSGRLSSCSAVARKVAGYAAIVGENPSRAAVERICDDVEAADVRHALDELLRAGVLHSTGPEHVAFRHALIRDAAYDSVPAIARAERHADVVRHILDGTMPDAAQGAELLQRHVTQAGRHLGTVQESAERLAAYGRHASDGGDAAGAIGPLEAAANLLPRGADLRLRTLCDLGSALADSGDLLRADEILSGAIGEAEATGQRAAKARAEIERAWLRIDSRPTSESFAAVAQSTRRALHELRTSGDTTGQVRAWLLLSAVYNLLGRRRAQVREAERVLALPPHRSGQRDIAVASGLVAGGMVEGNDDAHRLLTRCHELITLAHSDASVRGPVLGPQAVARALVGDFTSARRDIADAKLLAKELGSPWAEAMASWRSGQIEDLNGQWTAAERDFRFALETYRRLGERSHLSTVAAYLADVVARRGRDADCNDLLRLSIDVSSTDDVATQILQRLAAARSALERHDFAAAIAICTEGSSIASATDLAQIKGELYLVHAHALHAIDDQLEARNELRKAQREFRRKRSPVLLARTYGLRRRLHRGPEPSARTDPIRGGG